MYTSDGLLPFPTRRIATRQLTTFDAGKKTKTIPVPPGSRATLGEVEGAGYIASMWMTFPGWFWQHWNERAAVSQSILKTLVLRIYWDGCERPAVEVPAGDFFGNGLCEISNFASRYFGMSSGGFFCKYPMPYSKGFRIEVENFDGRIGTEVFLNVLYQQADEAECGPWRFHAQYHSARLNGPEPIEILSARGAGRYAGVVLSAQGEERNYLSFLEAPEYVWIDDEASPRIVGTGLEDYFLGGWYFREGLVAGPMHGVTSKDALNASVAMYRAHAEDAICFERSIHFQFVNPWRPERLKPFAYSSVAFFYLNAPEGQNPPLPAPEDMVCWYRIKSTDHASIP